MEYSQKQYEQGPGSLRELIDSHAKKTSSDLHIKSLSDVDAIRLIQQREGFTPCFGADTPLHEDQKGPSCCAERYCLWKAYCGLFRSNEVIPIEKVFPHQTKDSLDQIRKSILATEKADKFSLDTNTVGLKIRSLHRIASVSKRMLLAAPKTVFAEATDNLMSLKRYLVNIRTESPYMGGRVGAMYYYWDIVLSSDLPAVYTWLVGTQDFRSEGSLDYWPIFSSFNTYQSLGRDLYTATQGSDLWNRIFERTPIPESWIPKDTFEAPHLGFQDGDLMLTEARWAPLFHIDLPAIEGTDFSTLRKLMLDFPEELCSFRDWLYKVLDSLRDTAIGSESFTRECHKAEIALRDHLRKLNSDYHKTKIKTAFSLTGCAVASWTLAIYCILKGEGNILTLLGPGGIAYKLSSDYCEYITRMLELKENPVYILWRIGKGRASR